MKIRYSEVFTSFQGEAGFAGMPTIWVRFFGCTLKCMGFGQKNPADPSTYVNPYAYIKLADYTRLEDLPVFEVGCDSAYSWDKDFKHLIHTEEVSELVDRLIDMGEKDFGLDRNTNEFWFHPKTRQPVQLCFTGGEPMLWQKQMVAIVEEFTSRGFQPPQITIETNGTVPIKEADNLERKGTHLYYSVSPKLFSVSGEKDAFKPELLTQYFANDGWLKIVVNGTDECWEELDRVMSTVNVPNHWTKWLMPVGATKDQQSDIADLALECMRRGYHVATRNHAYVFGNLIGK